MKRLMVPALAILCCLSIAATPSPEPVSGPGKLIVHEWGTFTGLAGSDGRHLPFRAYVGFDLPSFVLTRPQQADRFDPGLSARVFEMFTKDETVALQRMETPVVYFYTDGPREVEAKVEFPKGMLTEFYPPVRSMTPAYDIQRGREVLSGTSLDWGKIRLVPQSVSANYPKIEGTTHYAQARATDAASVQFSDRPGEVHEENFLFYRGLGNFHLPVSLTASGRDQFVLHNQSGAKITTAFLIRTGGGGAKPRFSVYRNITAQQQITLPAPAEPEPTFISSTSVADDELASAMTDALVAEGLYEKEARAMVRTWESNWFGTEGTGTRVLYMLPRKVTDDLLPLHISPKPDATERVLVGRIDILTPEQESTLASMFKRVGEKEAIGAVEARQMRALGRFLQPALDRTAELQSRQVLNAIQSAEQLTVNGG